MRGSIPLFIGALAALALAGAAQAQGQDPQASKPPRGYSIPVIDLSADTARRVVVDREPGQYLGHPTTVLLEDGRTIITVYPKGHGRGAIVMKRSTDGGRTWSGRLPTPPNWETSLEVPTIYRVVDPRGKKRLIMFSGLYPIRLAVSEDDGLTWSGLAPIGDFGGIVAMASLVPLRTGAGHYMALFHDDGRFIGAKPAEGPRRFTVYKTISTDGGLTWGPPEVVVSHPVAHLCEPGALRSPDGQQIALLLRENSRKFNAFVIFSNDEGRTWFAPRELPGALTGDRHVAKYAPDGRLFITFRDMALESATKGDWVAWVGTYDDIVAGREGRFRVRLMDNHNAWDCAYPGLELLPDGTFVTTTYGHWEEGAEPYIVSVRLTMAEIDRLAASAARPR
jgi:hypothetical protein